jgi:ferrous iron transport protein B
MKYSPEIEREIHSLARAIEDNGTLAEKYSSRWLALQLLEGDTTVLNDAGNQLPDKVQAALAESTARLERAYNEELEIVIANQRYQFVRSLAAEIITRVDEGKLTLSDRIDRIITNQYAGVLVFLALMYVVLNIVQNVSAPYLDWIDNLFSGPLTNWITAFLTWINAPGWILSLIVDGVIAGVGGVLVFFPGIFAMYFMLAVLEQSGYLARAAFVMDRFMSKVGLHGKSFIPMILGFGCNVPAIYATRTIEKREARLLTALLIPFMSCAARLPVYLIFGLAFFPKNANLVILAMYTSGIIVAAVVGTLLSRVLFRGMTLSILVMELPAYRLPTVKLVSNYAWRQSRQFIRKAGTLIVGFSLILWFLLNTPWGVSDPQYSYYGRISSAISPVLEPAGFGTWETTGALVSGLVAKEIVVASLSQVYHVPQEVEEMGEVSVLEDVEETIVGLGEATLQAGKELIEVFTPGISVFPEEDVSGENVALSRALQKAFTPLSAIAFLLFVLLYVPCVATVGAQKQEFGWKWAAVSVAITLIVPWVISVMVYQVGSLLGLG